METPPPPGTPYRVGNWTVTQLKEELKNRNLSPAGKKQELIERLERFERDTASATPRYSRRARSPSKNTGRSISRKRAVNKSNSGLLDELEMTSTPARTPRSRRVTPELVSTPSAPLRLNDLPAKKETPVRSRSPPKRMTPTRTPNRSTPKATNTVSPLQKVTKMSSEIWGQAKAELSNQSSRNTFWALTALSFLFTVISIPFLLSKNQELEPLRQTITWYLRWFMYGLNSTLGFGDASHTFLFHLAPFVARVASSAYVCKSTAFDVMHPEGIACPREPYTREAVSMLSILGKVFFETVLWGLGSALGEFPAYVSARSFHAITQKTGTQSKYTKGISKWASKNLGFTAIVIMSAIPNSILEVTGMLCGYFGVPMSTFAPAFLIGKVLIRSCLQALLVIFVFSKDSLELILNFLKPRSSFLASAFLNQINAHRQSYQQSPVPSCFNSLWLRSAGKIASSVVLLYFLLRNANGLARIQANKLASKQ